MARLSTGERKRLIDIMKCERVEGLETIKRELEAERDSLIAYDTSLIYALDCDIKDLQMQRAAHESKIAKDTESAQLDNIAGRSCGNTHARIKAYKKETNDLERKILMGA